jgi:hypothetical protein
MAHHGTSKKRQWIVILQTGASLEYYADGEINVHISSTVVWAVVPGRLVHCYRRFGRAFCLLCCSRQVYSNQLIGTEGI